MRACTKTVRPHGRRAAIIHKSREVAKAAVAFDLRAATILPRRQRDEGRMSSQAACPASIMSDRAPVPLVRSAFASQTGASAASMSRAGMRGCRSRHRCWFSLGGGYTAYDKRVSPNL